jgi:hypothetical protein
MEVTNKYQNGKIYTIKSSQTNKYYIGSTIAKNLGTRLNGHKSTYNSYLKGHGNNMTSYEIIGLGAAYIELLEVFPCNSKLELQKREGELIQEHKLNCVNKNIAGRTQIEYRADNFETIKEIKKKYRINNKEKINERKKEIRLANKEKIKEQRKQYRLKNIEKFKLIDKQNHIKNAVKNKEHRQEYLLKNKEKLIQQRKEHRQKNKDILNQKQQEYRQMKKKQINNIHLSDTQTKHSI